MSIIVLVEKRQQACPFIHGLLENREPKARNVFPYLCYDADKGYGWQGSVLVELLCSHLHIHSCF